MKTITLTIDDVLTAKRILSELDQGKRFMLPSNIPILTTAVAMAEMDYELTAEFADDFYKLLNTAT
jgi:hypothetical protein